MDSESPEAPSSIPEATGSFDEESCIYMDCEDHETLDHILTTANPSIERDCTERLAAAAHLIEEGRARSRPKPASTASPRLRRRLFPALVFTVLALSVVLLVPILAGTPQPIIPAQRTSPVTGKRSKLSLESSKPYSVSYASSQASSLESAGQRPASPFRRLIEAVKERPVVYRLSAISILALLVAAIVVAYLWSHGKFQTSDSPTTSGADPSGSTPDPGHLIPDSTSFWTTIWGRVVIGVCGMVGLSVLVGLVILVVKKYSPTGGSQGSTPVDGIVVPVITDANLGSLDGWKILSGSVSPGGLSAAIQTNLEVLLRNAVGLNVERSGPPKDVALLGYGPQDITIKKNVKVERIIDMYINRFCGATHAIGQYEKSSAEEDILLLAHGQFDADAYHYVVRPSWRFVQAEKTSTDRRDTILLENYLALNDLGIELVNLRRG